MVLDDYSSVVSRRSDEDVVVEVVQPFGGTSGVELDRVIMCSSGAAAAASSSSSFNIKLSERNLYTIRQ